MTPRLTLRCVFLLLSACGARTGLDEGELPLDDGGTDRDATVTDGRDAATDPDAALPDAGPPACGGRPLPEPGAVTEVAMPPRMNAVGVLIPDPLGVIVVGGRTSADQAADQMAFLDLGRKVSQDLPVEGDAVVLPDRSAVAVYIPDQYRVVVIGGSGPDGEPLDQVFSFTGEGEAKGLGFRRVIAELLPAYPAGPVRGHVGVWDPAGRRVIVHGGEPLPDEVTDRRTVWALRLEPEPQWREVVPADESPVGRSEAMGYDPVRQVAVELVDGQEDFDGVSVYELDLEEGREGWSGRLDDVNLAPVTRGELLYDPTVCGFHVLSWGRLPCSLTHWVMPVGGPAGASTFRGPLELSPAHFRAASTFVAALDELVVYGSEDCEADGVPNRLAHEVALVR